MLSRQGLNRAIAASQCDVEQAVGEDKHGALLTVLAPLASQYVDLSDAAANLAEGPSETAIHNLRRSAAAR